MNWTPKQSIYISEYCSCGFGGKTADAKIYNETHHITVEVETYIETKSVGPIATRQTESIVKIHPLV